jgi:hypothetical protein
MRRGENVTEGGGVAREWRRQVADNRGADVLPRIVGCYRGKIVPNGTLTRREHLRLAQTEESNRNGWNSRLFRRYPPIGHGEIVFRIFWL